MVGFGLLWSSLPERVREEARDIITSWTPMLASYFSSYEQITIPEYNDDRQFQKNKLFDVVATYLRSRCMEEARMLKAQLSNDGREDTQLSLDDDQDVVDKSFRGYPMRWCLGTTSKNPSNRINPFPDEHGNTVTRHYTLVFRKRQRQLVLNTYLPSVVQQGRVLIAENQQRRLFTNHNNGMGGPQGLWSHIPWKHPATFDTLAMDPVKKDELIEDLKMFQKGKEYHHRVGKAWKRGYLLYGPPGTGKSSLISAMSHFLGYDVYDLDLTAAGTTNNELRKLFLNTTDRSIIIIEDIHAIRQDLTTMFNDKKKVTNGDELQQLRLPRDSWYERDRVTLSGLLNLIDGLWSAFGGERIFVLTTNHFDQLDPALIREGRMDMRIEMSYCRLEAFRVLAGNYLGITDHPSFVEIGQLLSETETTPAVVAHNLMPRGKRNAQECLAGLVQTLKKKKKAKTETQTSRSRGMSPVERPTYNLRKKKDGRGNRS
ncbi:AAA-ATPase At3g28540-like [Oryza brachyantha]|nr:AAA-ATPase At3g28540-like [Oryza brachyantha]